MKVDTNVNHIQTEWFKDVCWTYYTADGRIQEDRGVYLICDHGYHRWLTSICPYTNADKTTLEGYFSTNLESIQKVVVCTFGISKKQLKVLNNGFHYRNVNICKKIFVACCCLNNSLLDQMERNTVRAGCRLPIGNDGIWLDGHTTNPNVTDSALSIKFGKRRSLLANHLYGFPKKGTIL
jgi:hypothetical protein